MKTRDLALLSGLLLLMVTVQLVAVQGGTAAILLMGLINGFLLIAGLQLFGLPLGAEYWPAVLSFLSSLTGLAIASFWSPRLLWPPVWLAPLIATLAPAAWSLRKIFRAPRCQICRVSVRRLLSFSCPRCRLLACERCWEHEKCRCRLCESNRVQLFPQNSEWWNKNLGERVWTGKCSLCLTPAGPAGSTLHLCSGCHHPQCRLCWDDNNGQCSRCYWILAELPQTIMEHLKAGQYSGKFTLSSPRS